MALHTMRTILLFICFLNSSMLLAHGSEHKELASPLSGVVALTKGGRIQIPISDAVIAESRLDSDVQIKIVTAPIEGIVFVDSKAKTITYQHGGTSIIDDQLTYAIEHEGEIVTPPITLTFSFRVNNSGIRITSPSNGSQITGDKIEVEYEIFGFDYNHVHISYNQKTYTIEDVTGVYTISDIEPGSHVVSIELANKQHRIINSRRAKDSVSFEFVE